MRASVTCPNPSCGESYEVDPQRIGGQAKCGKCGTEFRLTPSESIDSDSQARSAVTRESETSQVQASEQQTAPARKGSVEVPETFGHYRMVRELGRGGMAVVYLAEDSTLKRPVAIKIPFDDPRHAEQTRTRFLREAQAAARVSHPNICHVYEARDVEGQPYLAIEYIDGKPLSDVLRGQTLSERRAANLVRKIALALEAAHRAGLVHRDLKPANVMLTRGGEPKVTDFGLARAVVPDESARITRAGAVLGTPAYMPREQALGEEEKIGPLSDVYSLGVVLYELLCGRVPFDGPPAVVLGQVIASEPPPPSSHVKGLDPKLEAICLKAMSKEPEDRFQSMLEFAESLTDWLRRRGADRNSTTWNSWTKKLSNQWRNRRPSPRFLWGGLGGIVVLIMCATFVFRLGDGTNSLKSPIVNHKDPDRAAAEWVLSLPRRFNGESCCLWIQVGDDTRAITSLSDLPSGPFAVRDLDLVVLAVDANEALAYIRPLKDLRSLRLRDEAVSETLLSVLIDKPLCILELHVVGRRMSETELQSISNLRHLEGLVISFAELTDEGLQALSSLDNLHSLWLTGSDVHDSQLVHLRSLKGLRYLSLRETAVGGSSLSILGSLPQLSTLDLTGTELTDEGLRSLSALPALRHIYVADTAVSSDGVSEFRVGNPQCRVEWSENALPERTPGSSSTSTTDDSATSTVLEDGNGASTAERVVNLKPAPTADSRFDRLQAARDWVTSIGGHMEGVNNRELTVSFPNVGDQISDADLERFSGLSEIVAMMLVWTRVTDDGMKSVAELPNLRTLNLNQVPISDIGIAHLRPLQGLRNLHLSNSRVTDVGLQTISGFTQLEELVLSGSPVTDEGVRHLVTLKNLRMLRLDGTQIGDGALQMMPELPNLQELQLWRTSVSDTGIASLSRCPHLKDLDISSTALSDSGLSALNALDLEALDIRKTKVTEDGLIHLSAMEHLSKLSVSAHVISEIGSQYLSELPELKILFIEDDTGNSNIADLSCLADLPHLESLSLGAGTWNDETASQIGRISTLRTLHIFRPSFTVAGATALRPLTALQELTMWGAPIDEPILEELKRVLPDCTITCNGQPL